MKSFLRERERERETDKALRLLTGAVKRYLSAAVVESGPGAVVHGPCLHNARLGGVRLGSPHQDTDPGGEKEKPEHMQDPPGSMKNAQFDSFIHQSFSSVSILFCFRFI